ncbi:hypothetical protein D9M68_924860 [compost metagenome]
MSDGLALELLQGGSDRATLEHISARRIDARMQSHRRVERSDRRRELSCRDPPPGVDDVIDVERRIGAALGADQAQRLARAAGVVAHELQEFSVHGFLSSGGSLVGGAALSGGK